MIDSFELYKETLTFSKNNSSGRYNPFVNKTLKNYYLQLEMMIFYELTTKKTSPLISFFCQTHCCNFTSKNFTIAPMKIPFNLETNFDMYLIVYGLNVVFAENLDSCQNVFESHANDIFCGMSLHENEFPNLIKILQALDESLGKFCAKEKVVEKIVERRIEIPVEKIVEKRVEVPVQQPLQKIPSAQDEQDKEFLQSLNAFAENRYAADEKIIGEIQRVQLDLQEELPRLQNTLKKISEIRDGLVFESAKEPIYQLVNLFDKINETLQSHPKADAQKGYENLIKRCRNFSRYVEQSLAMLGAELIKEPNVPFDFAKHEATEGIIPSESATVSKILSVGLIYKGQILRKAEVEIATPAPKVTSRLGNFLGGKFL